MELDGNRLIWVTREGDKEVRYHSEPHTDLMKRIEAGVISWLPIEWLLWSIATKPTRRFHAPASVSIFTCLLTAAIALALDSQTKAEIDESITYVQTSGVRFIRSGKEYPGLKGQIICVGNLPRPVTG